MSYRLVSLYPQANEINRPQQKSVPQNIIMGSYNNLDHYLATHFTLLREDFIKPIREDICTYLHDSRSELKNIKIHEVRFIRKGIKHQDICYSLEIQRGITYQTWHLDQKHFMLGSLLIFSKDNFKTVFCGRVADDSNIIYRKVLVSFELPVHISYNTSYNMVECNNFFEPYYQVLKVIQQIDRIKFPMVEHLVEARTSVGMPEYLSGIAVKVSDCELNDSQQIALNAALSQRLVLIQGPPGTGKTYLGLKIAKQLLSRSRQWWDGSPMLVISFTNHALDQFLENITDSTDRILRLGGQSKNSKMKNYTMAECRRKYFNEKPLESYRKSLRGNVFKEFYQLEKIIKSVGNQMDNLASSRPTCIFYFNVLAEGVPTISSWFNLSHHTLAVTWLLEEDGSMGQEPLLLTGSEDRKNIASLYEGFLKEEINKKGSQYCMLSLSIMGSCLQSMYDKIVETSTGIKATNLKRPGGRLKEKKCELKKLIEVYHYLLRKINYLKVCLRTSFDGRLERDKLNSFYPFKMPVRVRWQLYQYWLTKYESHLTDKMEDLIEEYRPLYSRFNEIQESNNLALIKHQKIIGMTTTMAARMHSLIKKVKCPIVIVEEAAQVLEAHIIPVLTEHCQHLILIGDHQQLKPTTVDYEIEIAYHLGVSMFERLIRNKVQFYTLNVQHRMRPEIASLVTPSIYPVLHNHECVKKFPDVMGMGRNLFFLSHRCLENSAGDKSKKNLHEATFLIRLAVYLLQNSYQAEDITILAAYLGQVGALNQVQSKHADKKVKNIRITSVDDYQGEENKIILLSLVRNNERGSIGFLSIHNRVCVALSRAKEGMYVMGNIEMLMQNSQLWRKIGTSLKKTCSVGTSLPLKCTNHDAVTEVQTVEDFDKMAPCGGCNQPCGFLLACGHNCKMICHPDDHASYSCTEPCLKSVCSRPNHKCPKLCYQECGVCTHELKRTLACGHPVRCFMEKQLDFSCLETVHVRLSCGHKQKVSCNMASSGLKVVCSVCDNADEKFKSIDKDVLDGLVRRVRQVKLEDSDSESEVELPEKPEDLGVFVKQGSRRD